jgi:hypothetical protein
MGALQPASLPIKSVDIIDNRKPGTAGRTEGAQRRRSGRPPRTAVEILLSDPESLGVGVFESCRYILRDKLRSA